jgi:hypothetical protein
MPQKSRNRYLARAALCAAFAAFLVIAGDPGAAYAADDSIGMMPLPDGNAVRRLLHQLGIVGSADQDATDYKERPPLVVPPSRALPPPAAPGSLAERNPAWPVDKRKPESKAKTERRDVSWENDRQPLSTARPAPSAEMPAQATVPSQASESDGSWSRFWDKALGRKAAPEIVPFTREPPRASLTDPPRGYRTPSPDQPYGANITADTTPWQAPRDPSAKGNADRQ